MAEIMTLGPVGFNPLGEYNSETLYERLDMVLYQGVSYVAKQNIQGQPPTNSTYWDALGVSGADMSNYYIKSEVDNLIPTELNELNGDSTHRVVTDTQINRWDNKVDVNDLSTVATSGNYNDLSNKPTIPTQVTESTVSGWGFTKNTGTYIKPSTGIPKTDLASSVQASLEKADSAIQSHQDVSGKEDKSNKITSISSSSTDIEYPSAKSVYTYVETKVGEINTYLDAINGEVI